MSSKKPYGSRSLLFGGIGVILLILSYAITPDVPQGFMYFMIGTIFILSLTFITFGIMNSVIALRRKETGKIKYAGLIVPIIIISYIIVIPIIMGLLFTLNNHP